MGQAAAVLETVRDLSYDKQICPSIGGRYARGRKGLLKWIDLTRLGQR